MDLNKVMIIGRLTRDPELRTLSSGVSVVNFSVATNLIYTDQSGVKQQKVEYHEIVMWRKLAEIAHQYLRKAAKIYIEGRLQTRSWDDPNGFKRYKTEIIADNMIMLDRPPQAGGDFGATTYTAPQPQSRPVAPAPSRGAPAPRPLPPQEEEIPTIDVTEDVTPKSTEDEEEVSIEDIPF